MTHKNNIALFAEIDERAVLFALQSVVVSYVYIGNERVKTRRKNWSSS